VCVCVYVCVCAHSPLSRSPSLCRPLSTSLPSHCQCLLHVVCRGNAYEAIACEEYTLSRRAQLGGGADRGEGVDFHVTHSGLNVDPELVCLYVLRVLSPSLPLPLPLSLPLSLSLSPSLSLLCVCVCMCVCVCVCVRACMRESLQVACVR
jgi:hypothetical protein